VNVKHNDRSGADTNYGSNRGKPRFHDYSSLTWALAPMLTPLFTDSVTRP